MADDTRDGENLEGGSDQNQDVPGNGSPTSQPAPVAGPVKQLRKSFSIVGRQSMDVGIASLNPFDGDPSPTASPTFGYAWLPSAAAPQLCPAALRLGLDASQEKALYRFVQRARFV